ncbi:hypothetical protein GCM10011504_25480 [Siccirubricoccus deserti]|uniref:Uncharacterized protein n=1 Tax=Siccirubricoccus deserti TaxID=2013562 RepID=A0A9X0QZH6_9PROT|nr:hypothetical protein [Siccirubricoccus deserti]MBC4016118.1 hypothetical protein [Siccirubricoccus deserti]GGC45897.1 hypothetical protein GCM10011504_25480 [Siccirubricoccus deserti]
MRHLDVDACPGGTLAVEQGCCRLALQGSDVLIYEFRQAEGSPCLVQVPCHDGNAVVARHGVNHTRR